MPLADTVMGLLPMVGASKMPLLVYIPIAIWIIAPETRSSRTCLAFKWCAFLEDGGSTSASRVGPKEWRKWSL